MSRGGWTRVATAGLLAVSFLVALYGVETYVTLSGAARPETLSSRIAALRRDGTTVYQAYVPAYRAKAPSGQMPLAGVRLMRTVFEDDSGFTVYDSDEFGFRNPRGLWHPGVEIAIVGDSFANGFGAPEGGDIASVLRRAYPHALNVGVTGTGQIVQLAIMREYLAAVRPARVVLVYFESNDVTDTALELRDPILQRYYFDTGFSQHLSDAPDPVDAGLRAFLEDGVASTLQREGPPPPRDLRTIVGAVVRLRGLRALVEAVRQRRERRERIASAGCHVDYAKARIVRLVVDEAGQTVGTEPAPQAAELAAELAAGPSAFLAARHLLLGNSFNTEMLLVPEEVYRGVLVRMRDLVRGWGGELSFLYMPALPTVLHPECDPNRAQIASLVQAAGIPFLDATDPIREQGDPRALYVTHLNARGYRLIGEYLADRLAPRDARRVTR